VATLSPKVSAIIIVLDGERFIGEAIESVLSQQGPSVELLVVDDGSTDHTAEIVGAFGRRARLLAHPGGANLGMSASRNAGVSQASGEYIAFLDADDHWLPHKLGEQVAILDREPATAMVYGRTIIWHSWDQESDQADYLYDLRVPADRTYAAGALFGQLLANRYQSPTTCNAMIRRQALLAVGGCDPALRGMFEDQLLFAKLLLRYPAHVSSRSWARYRQHGQSASAAAGGRLSVARQQLRYLCALRNYMVSSGGIPVSQRAMLELRIAQLSGRMAARQAAGVLRSRLE
jgi:glycosyltransferase involved in cell wall biosynthesis